MFDGACVSYATRRWLSPALHTPTQRASAPTQNPLPRQVALAAAGRLPSLPAARQRERHTGEPAPAFAAGSGLPCGRFSGSRRSRPLAAAAAAAAAAVPGGGRRDPHHSRQGEGAAGGSGGTLTARQACRTSAGTCAGAATLQPCRCSQAGSARCTCSQGSSSPCCSAYVRRGSPCRRPVRRSSLCPRLRRCICPSLRRRSLSTRLWRPLLRQRPGQHLCCCR